MLGFDRKFLKLLGELGILLYLFKRYVDDIMVEAPPIRKGWVFREDRRVLEFDQELEDEIPDDQGTMALLTPLTRISASQ